MIFGIQKGAIILTTTHLLLRLCGVECSSGGWIRVLQGFTDCVFRLLGFLGMECPHRLAASSMIAHSSRLLA